MSRSTSRPGSRVAGEPAAPRSRPVDAAVVVAVPASRPWRTAVAWAALESRRRAAPVHLVAPVGVSRAALAEAIDIARSGRPADTVTAQGPDPHLWSTLVGCATTATLLVLPFPGFSRSERRSVRHLLAAAACPVVLTPARPPDPVDGADLTGAPVVALVDPADRGRVLVEALAEASRRWTDLAVVATAPISAGNAQVRRLIAGFPDVRAQWLPASEDPRRHVLDRADRAGLLVVGAAEAIGAWAGSSLLDRWCERAPCPLMVVPVDRRPDRG